MLADEVDATLTAPSDWWNAGSTPRRRRRWPWLVAAAVLLSAVFAPVVELARSW